MGAKFCIICADGGSMLICDTCGHSVCTECIPDIKRLVQVEATVFTCVICFLADKNNWKKPYQVRHLRLMTVYIVFIQTVLYYRLSKTRTESSY